MNNMVKKYKRTKFACYSAYFTMSSVFSLPPLLFVTLRSMYNISYTLLGTLVLTNFCTQMIIDLIFTVFSKHFNVKKVVRVMPVSHLPDLWFMHWFRISSLNMHILDCLSERLRFPFRQVCPKCFWVRLLRQFHRIIRKRIWACFILFMRLVCSR